MVADPISPPHDKACGEGLMPAALNIADRLESISCRVRDSRCAGSISSGLGLVKANFPEGAGLGIRRTTLHALLADQAARNGVELFWGSGASAYDGTSVRIGSRQIRARWIVGADGGASSIRRWAGLDKFRCDKTRFGFRRHYAIEPWTSHVEIHWGDGCQLYITPVSRQEVGVALLSRDSHLRVQDALPRFPELKRRLAGAEPTSRERGGCSSARRLRRVTQGRVALIGDASGSVDAITGDGITLAFQQAEALAEALAGNDLNVYEAEHRRISQRPAYMGELLLALDRHPRLRERALRALASRPSLFADLLALHVGSHKGAMNLTRIAAALSWRLVAA